MLAGGVELDLLQGFELAAVARGLRLAEVDLQAFLDDQPTGTRPRRLKSTLT